MKACYPWPDSSTTFFSIALILVLTLAAMAGFEYIDEQDLTYAGPQPVGPPQGEISIVIKVNSRLLELYCDDQIYKKYRIAVGKRATPSPVGEWLVVYKSYSDKDIFGTRWLGLNVPWGSYGIHGTNRPWSIGQFASQGCIRLRNIDIEELFEWVPVNTPVKIIGSKVKFYRNMRYTSSGPDVVSLQLRLQQLGFFGGRADGLFGKTTDEAVKAFQSERNIDATGIVDAKTAKLLGL